MSEAKKCVNLACRYYGQHVCRCYPDEGAAGTEPHVGTLNVLPSTTVGKTLPIQRPPENPSLPKLLRALARGTDAQEKQTSVIFDAAADELEYWRGLEAAKVIGQGHQNNDNVPARADHKYEPGTFGVCRRCGKGPH